MFISPDTVIPDPTDFFSYNRYLYARGNPVSNNDPGGHAACGATGSSDSGVGAVIQAVCEVVSLAGGAAAAGGELALPAVGSIAMIYMLIEGVNAATYEPLPNNSVPYPASEQGQLTGSFPIPGSTTVTIDGIPLIQQEAPVIQGIPAEQPSMLITLARMTPDQQALGEVVKETHDRRPLTKEEAEAALDWAQEVGLPWRASADDVNGNHWIGPHIHIHGVGVRHIEVEPGVTPR